MGENLKNIKMKENKDMIEFTVQKDEQSQRLRGEIIQLLAKYGIENPVINTTNGNDMHLKIPAKIRMSCDLGNEMTHKGGSYKCDMEIAGDKKYPSFVSFHRFDSNNNLEELNIMTLSFEDMYRFCRTFVNEFMYSFEDNC